MGGLKIEFSGKNTNHYLVVLKHSNLYVQRKEDQTLSLKTIPKVLNKLKGVNNTVLLSKH